MHQYFKKNLGQLIALRRSELGYSQVELAKRMKLSRPHLSKLETGDSSPPLETLMIFNRVLGINLLDNDLIKLEKDGITKEEYAAFASLQNNQNNKKFDTVFPGNKIFKIVDLVEPYFEKEYLEALADKDIKIDMPKNFVVVDQEDRNEYLSYRMKNDIMVDGTMKSIPNNAIVTGRKLKRQFWSSQVNTMKSNNHIIVLRNKIIFGSINDVDSVRQVITVGFLNPDKVSFPSIDIKLNDCFDIYSLAKVTVGE